VPTTSSRSPPTSREPPGPPPLLVTTSHMLLDKLEVQEPCLERVRDRVLRGAGTIPDPLAHGERGCPSEASGARGIPGISGGEIPSIL
jgi:hypothetical protein